MGKVSAIVKRLKEIVNLRTFVAAICVSLLGFGLLYSCTPGNLWIGYEVWRVLLQSVGGVLFGTGVITVVWEVWVKRSFLDEVLARVKLADDVKYAGIARIPSHFYTDIDWKLMFRDVNRLDIFFAYGRTWRNTYVDELKELALREDARIRVVLPDPDDNQTVSELARRFAYTPDQLKGFIVEAEQHFRDLREESIRAGKGAQIDIWFLPASPTFTFYRFDRKAVLTLYSHTRKRTSVPTFVVEMGGTLYDYIRKEFDAMISDGLARHVTTSRR